MTIEIGFTDIAGIKVGHAQNYEAGTGCTVVICEEGATAGVDVRGGAPGTRETDLLNPVNLVDKIHAVILSGGSAFGLDAAAGVMRYLEEKGVGFDVQVTKVPIVCGAVLFDLNAGDCKVRPDREMGYEACLNSSSEKICKGSVGAGTGATVGKILGIEHAMKGGIATHAVQNGDLKVGAIVAVNCLGDVIDPLTSRKIAGVLEDDMVTIGYTESIMVNLYSGAGSPFVSNTTIGVVVTNAVLTKAEATKVASMAQDGLARTMRPSHTMFDGDTIFALSSGDIKSDVTVVGILAARAVERAVIEAVRSASSLLGIRSASDLSS